MRVRDGHAEGKKAFIQRLKERFFLRFHMALILGATALAGLLASKVLLLLDLNNMILRYPLAVLISYGAFFLCIKLWLLYMTSYRKSGIAGSAGDLLPDMMNVLPDFASAGGTPSFSGGGGLSGGGGASGSFEGPIEGAQDAVASVSRAASETSSGAADSAVEVSSGLFDYEGALLLALGLLLAAIFGSAVYLVYDAPLILSEAVFNFLLAAGMLRSYKKVVAPDWIGGIARTTYRPFLVVMLISVVSAWIITANYPGVTKVTELCVVLISGGR